MRAAGLAKVGPLPELHVRRVGELGASDAAQQAFAPLGTPAVRPHSAPLPVPLVGGAGLVPIPRHPCR